MPGVFVQLPYGQVPPSMNWHSPCVAYAPGPVSEYVAWISDSPSGVPGRSHVAYENWMPRNAMSCTGSVSVPCPATNSSRRGATTVADRGSSPWRGR